MRAMSGCLAVLLLAVAPAAAAENVPPAADPGPDSDVRVLLDEMTLSFGFDRKGGRPYAEMETHLRLRVEREDGHAAARRRIPYRRGASEVTAIEASTTLPDGRVVRLDPDRIRDEMVVTDGALYSDVRAKRFTIPLAAPGAVLECRYAVRDYDLDFAWTDILGNVDPSDRVRFRVRVPAGAVVQWGAFLGNAPVDLPPAVSPAPDGGQEWTWEAADVPGTPREPFAAPLVFRVPRVLVWLKSMEAGGRTFTGLPDVAGLAAWVDARYREQAVADRDLQARVREVLAAAGGPQDPAEQARVLYEWVQDSVRYVAVELGEGGWVPRRATEVLASRFGDCKDKANLLAAMLRTAGIESVPVLILARDGVSRRVVVPSRGAFNHAILGVRLGDRLVLADPTSTTVPFGRLPESDQDADILVADTARPRMDHVPWDPPGRSATDERYDLAVAPDGTMTGDFTLRFAGARAFGQRAGLRILTPAARRRHVARLLALSVDGLEVESFDAPGVGARDDTFVITGRVRGQAPVAYAGSAVLVQPGELLGSPDDVPPPRERRTAYLRNRNGLRTVRVALRLPAAVRGVEPAWGGARDGAGASHEWKASAQDGALVLERTVRVVPVAVPREHFGEEVSRVLRDQAASEVPVRALLDGEVRP